MVGGSPANQLDPYLTPSFHQRVGRLTIASFCCIGAALACVLALGIGGAWWALTEIRGHLLLSEIGRVRAVAECTAVEIESHLAEDRISASELGAAPWLRSHWEHFMLRQPERLYGAVVDISGTVVAHSNLAFQGRRLAEHWYDRILPDWETNDVVESRSAALAGGRRAFDVQVPILLDGRKIGTYHAGLNAVEFDRRVDLAQKLIVRRWTLVMGGILLVVSLGTASLYHIVRRNGALEQGLELAHIRRVTELTQLMIGLAHEVRNPLNAVRLNLHMIGRVFHKRNWLPTEELASMVHDSVAEIVRVEALIREMLGFAHVESEPQETIELAEEIHQVLTFTTVRLTILKIG